MNTCSEAEGTLTRHACEAEARIKCRNEADDQAEVCGAESATCYASCGPMAQDRPHVWCTGMVDTLRPSFFCEGDPARPTSDLTCIDRPEWQNLSTSLTCQGLASTTPSP
jgi:hypothetical protein